VLSTARASERVGLASQRFPTDHGFMATLYRIAIREGIRFILSGTNISTEGISVPGWGYHYRDLRSLTRRSRPIRNASSSNVPVFGFFTEIYYRAVKRIKVISLLNYMSYVKSDAMETIQRELGWQYYGGKALRVDFYEILPKLYFCRLNWN